MMEQRMQESLSALMDGEANELELARLLKQSDSAEVRSAWVRMHSARAVVRGDRDAAVHSLDFADRVSAGLGSEEGASSGRLASLLQPLASFAVAASVFAAVLVGSQFYSLAGLGPDFEGEEQVADRVSTVGMVNTLGGAAVPASFGTRNVVATPAAATVSYNQIARKRLQRYLVPHTDAASLNTPQGMMPYARVASFPVATQD